MVQRSTCGALYHSICKTGSGVDSLKRIGLWPKLLINRNKPETMNTVKKGGGKKERKKKKHSSGISYLILANDCPFHLSVVG